MSEPGYLEVMVTVVLVVNLAMAGLLCCISELIYLQHQWIKARLNRLQSELLNPELIEDEDEP